MWIDTALLLIWTLVFSILGYKGYKIILYHLKEIYGKFDTIYYMLCDVFKKRYNRQLKKEKKK